MSKAKGDASLSDISIDAPALLGRSAADRAFDVPEIRQQILEVSGMRSRAVMMRVDKRWIYQAVKKLYAQLSYDRLRIYLKSGTDLHMLFASVVSDLDCSRLEGGVVREDFGLQGKHTLNEYCPEIFADFIPSLRDKCPNLRLMVLGVRPDPISAFKGTSWTITFHDTRPEVSTADYVDNGHIRIHHALKANIFEEPQPLTTPLPPSNHYTIEDRMDLYFAPQFHRTNPPLSCHDSWLTFIRQTESFSHLNQMAQFGRLQIPLGDITDLAKRQIAAGHQLRLRCIMAERCEPFTISQIASFASVVSSGLWLLNLCNGYSHAWSDDIFNDLPALCHIVRSSMPNLGSLTLALSGIEDVEAICLSALSHDSLDTSGNLRDLTFHADAEVGRMPSAVRCVYGLCFDRAELKFVFGPSREDDDEELVHQEFLHYLQKQPLSLRRTLATLDLGALSGFIQCPP